MKKFYVLLLVSLFCLGLQAEGWRTGEMEVKVYLNQPADYETLYTFHYDGEVYPGFARMFLLPSELARIQESGLQTEILIGNLNEYYKDFWQTDDAYHSYDQMVALADSLVAAFPNICTKHIFGTSLENRQLAALKISDNSATDENEAEVMFDGGIHGDEIGGPENCIRFARDLCLAYGNDPTLTDLIDNREIWIYYMVNPDGRVHMQRENMNGVDLNRDYGYMWDAWSGSTGAYSQVETKALRNCAFDNQFVVHTTYHSGTEIVSYPWSYRPDASPDQAHIHQLAGIYSSQSGYGYLEYGQGYSSMYAINGSTKDGNYGANGAISWSIEISMDKQPPASQIMQYYNYNKPSMIALIEYAGYGIQGTVKDAGTGNAIPALIFVNSYYPTTTDPVVGDYHKYILPGTYTVKVVANGYQSQTATNVVVTAGGATVKDFLLTPQAGQFAHRFCSSQIPDNNYSDEGKTFASLGPPDNVNYSIGKNGWCVLDLLTPIPDGAGPDIKVFEGDASPEGYTCYVGQSMDGPWHSLGAGTATMGFDIALSGLTEARYVKIVDDGDGSANQADAGFDLDAVSKLDPVSGVYLAMTSVTIDDAGGNNNGKIDPGETVNLIVTLKNNGDADATNVTGTLSCSSSFIVINTASAGFGNIGPGQTANGTFTVTAGATTPAGTTADMLLDVTCNGGAYTNSFTMSFVIGQIPVLIVNWDGNNNSAGDMQSAVVANGLSADLQTSLPSGLSQYSSIFVCLGVYSDNHVLSTSEGQQLATYLNAGGNLYMEGGDTWYYDDPTAVHPMFNINGEGDGSSDLGTILGQTGTFTEGMTFSYSGDNNWIDHLSAVSPAVLIFKNQSPVYGTGVANDAGAYRTIGCSHEFGGLDDGTSPSTKAELMYEYLNFFGLIAIGPVAAFTANNTQPCTGATVHFTDNSAGNPTSWSWTFEGGTPSTSIQQNPDVVYANAGTFDVTLTVSDGTNSNTLTKNDYITAITQPGQAAQPAGDIWVCTNLVTTSLYTTTGGTGASSYVWQLLPAAAGSIAGSGTTGTVSWTNSWEGTATIQVKGVNACGEGPFSDPLNVTCQICSGIGNTTASRGLRIEPNPNDGCFKITGGQVFENRSLKIEVFDAMANIIYAGQATGKPALNEEIVLDHPRPGLYVVRLSGDGKVYTGKFIIR